MPAAYKTADAMPTVASAIGAPKWASGSTSSSLASTSKAAAAIAKVEAMATTRRDAESDASSGTTTSQMAAKDVMPPVKAATVVTRPVSASDERQ